MLLLSVEKLYTYVTRDVGVGEKKIIKTDCGPVKELLTQSDVEAFYNTVVSAIFYCCGSPSEGTVGAFIDVFQEKVTRVDMS